MKSFDMQGANPNAKRRRIAGAAAGALAVAVVFAGVTWPRSEPLVQTELVAPVQTAQSWPPAPVPPSPRRIGDHRTAARFLQFEPNRGQAPQAVRYLSRGPAHRVEIFDDGMALSATAPGSAGEGGADASAADASARLRFVGARNAVGFEAREPGPGQAHYLVGDDASKWIRSVPGYRQLRRPELYPGIDLVYYSREGALEFDLVVKPGADPSRIRMHVGGAQPPAIEASGDLLLDGAGGSLRLHRPVLYQNIAGEKKILDARYVLRGERTVGFALPAYDKRYPLVIDPVFKLLYSTYLTGFHDEQVGAMALDAQSNAYVIGRTNSDDFVVSSNALQKGKSTVGLQYNIVLTKFDASGTLIYSTYLGGSGSDIATAIAVDAAGNAYVTGNTTSRDFPVTAGAQQSTFTGSLSAFLAVVSPDGSVLAHSTYYGGSGSVQATAIALDAGDAPVIAGFADAGLVTTPGAYKTTLAAGDAAFVARFSAIAAGAPRLLAASYYGVDNPQANATARGNHAFSMALDASGAPWLTGQAFTTNLPTTAAAVQSAPAAMSPSCAPSPAPLNSFAFVARLSADLASLTYASYLTGATEPAGGAACSEFGHSLALDSSGNVYLTGATGSAAFPTTAGAVQATFPSAAGVASYTGFITKLKPDGSAILWSTYLGGNGGNTFPAVIALDPANAAVWTTSVTGGGSNYPISADALQKVHGGGGADAGLVQLDATTGALKYSTFLGGLSADVGLALGVDSGGNAFVAGNTFSSNFPLTANAYESAYRPDFFGGSDWFFTILGSGTISRVTPASLGTGGDGTLTIFGAGFVDGASCLLSGAADIASSLSGVSGSGTSITCSFDLASAAPGSYDVTIVNPDGSRLTRKAALMVEAGTESSIAVDVVGRAVIRAGVAAPFSVTVRNTGNRDAYNVMLFIHYSQGLKPLDATANPFGLPLIDPALITFGDPTQRDYRTVPVARPSDDSDGSSVIQLMLPFMAAGKTVSLPLTLGAADLSDDQYVEAWAWEPLSESIADFTSPSSNARAHVSSARSHPQASKQLSEECQKALWDYAVKKALEELKDAILDENAPAKALEKLKELLDQAKITGHALGQHPELRTAQGVAVATEQMFPKFVDGYAATAAALGIKTATFAKIMEKLAKAMEKADDIAEIADKCKDQTKPKPKPKGAKKKVKIKSSNDPNDISGPIGDASAAHYLDGSGAFAYEIEFENMASASLPAAEVVVTTTVDRAKFDVSTLTLGDIYVGNTLIGVPPGLSSYATTLLLKPTLKLRVQGSLNPATGVLKWTFNTLDPATGLPPSDPTLGFLPPDVDGVSGQGRLQFSVKTRSAQAQGSVWSMQASVVFDANAPIATPAWLNTLDTTAPTSKIESLTSRAATTTFDVVWSGSDSGAGVRAYSVYVSDNGAPFAIWQSGVSTTTAAYNGVSGHSYGFYVIASDGAGNTEASKSTAESSIAVNGTFADTSGGGGGCTIGGDDPRDATLTLLVLLAAISLAALRRRRRQAAAASQDAA